MQTGTQRKKPQQFLLYVIAIMLFSCSTQTANNTETDVLRPLIVHSRGGDLSLLVEIADSVEEQAAGLMYRQELSENAGMLFVFSDDADRAFWMKNTALSLDIIYIDSDKTIVGIIKNTTPYSEEPLTVNLPSRFVLEVAAGYTTNHQVVVGDTIEY